MTVLRFIGRLTYSVGSFVDWSFDRMFIGTITASITMNGKIAESVKAAASPWPVNDTTAPTQSTMRIHGTTAFSESRSIFSIAPNSRMCALLPIRRTLFG